MSRKFTVIWLAHGNPVQTKITLDEDHTADALNYDDWLAYALVAYWAEPGMGGGTWDDAQLYIQDVDPGLAAVVRGHDNVLTVG